MINHLLLRASITDGCDVAQANLSLICPTATPTPTASLVVTSTPTPTPTQTPAESEQLFSLNTANNYTYNLNNNIIARFIPLNSNISNTEIQTPAFTSSSAALLTPTSIVWNGELIGQIQFDASRLVPGATTINIAFEYDGNFLAFNDIALAAPTIILT